MRRLQERIYEGEETNFYKRERFLRFMKSKFERIIEVGRGDSNCLMSRAYDCWYIIPECVLLSYGSIGAIVDNREVNYLFITLVGQPEKRKRVKNIILEGARKYQ